MPRLPSRRIAAQICASSLIVIVVLSCNDPDDDIYCGSGGTDIPALTGTIGVRVETTGSAIPAFPPGFTVQVNAFAMSVDPLGGFANFQNLDPGTYSVSLTGLTASCLVQQALPMSVTVDPGDDLSFTLDVTCDPDASVQVIVQSLGTATDPDGFTATVNGVTQAIPPPSGSTLFADVPVGDRNVSLGGLTAPCVVVGENPRLVPVPTQQLTTVVFVVDCSGQSGTLRVTTVTTGSDLDPDGYFVTVAGQNIVFANNFTFDFTSLPVGDHQVTLQNVASNCTVAGQNPRTVPVTAGSVTPTTFDVACGPPAMVLFESDRDGDLEVYQISPDGTGLTQMTTNTAPDDDEDPAWSWDRQKIAFRSDRTGDSEIWVMNADRSNPMQITTTGPDDHNPAFSPNGMLLVYDTGDEDLGTLQIVISNSDGSGIPLVITGPPGVARNPSFNPAGTRILFESNRDGDWDLYTMGLIGQNIMQVTNTPGTDIDGAWSPTVAGLIVFSSQGGGGGLPGLWTVTESGAGLAPVANGANARLPTFSPDGQQIIFTSDRDGSPDLFRINVDGSGLLKFPNQGGAIDEDAHYTYPPLGAG
jgi:TolB protein